MSTKDARIAELEQELAHHELLAVQLRESEQKYRELIEALPHAVAIVRSRKIVFANPATLKMLGVATLEELQKAPVTIGLPEHEQAWLIPELTRRLDGDGPWPFHYEAKARRADGTSLPTEVYCSRIEFQQHRAVQFLIIDTTERERAARERAAMQSQLHQADKMSAVGQLAAGVAHEINNPVMFLAPNLEQLEEHIGTIAELVELHSRGASPAEVAAFLRERRAGSVVAEMLDILRDAREATRRIVSITRELRQFSRTGEGGVEPVRLTELVESGLTMATNELKYRARVIREFEDLPAIVVDRGKMSQVFLNMIINAAQAIPEGRVAEHWVRVRSGQTDDMIFVEIANNGEPIPKEDVARIFNPFYTTKPRGQGTGLGLAICGTVVQQHGGRIDVTSGTETAFCVWLPKETGLEVPEAGPPRKSTLEGSARILVVDDEVAILRTLERMLRHHVVVTASSGREALSLVRSQAPFDVILCDLMMPEVSGMDLFEEMIAEQPQLRERFVMMTGGAFTPRAASFFESTTLARLEKPIGSVQLRETIARILEPAAS